jgi:hypothetical protein
MKGAIKAIIAFLSAERYKNKTYFQAIRVKNNIRAFYTKEVFPFCIKILISNVRNIRDMETEIKTRKKVSKYNILNIPKILGEHLDFDPPFFTEEMIWGEKPIRGKNTDKITQVLCPEIWGMYSRYGISAKKIEEFFDTSEFYTMLSKGADKIPWREDYGKKCIFLKIAKKIVFSRGYVQYSLGHGDLSIGNIIISAEDKIFLTDWEQAHERPILFDLYEIITEVPGSREYFERELSNYQEKNKNYEFITFKDQLKFGALIKIKKWFKNYFTAPAVKIPGMEARISKAISNVIKN